MRAIINLMINILVIKGARCDFYLFWSQAEIDHKNHAEQILLISVAVLGLTNRGR